MSESTPSRDLRSSVIRGGMVLAGGQAAGQVFSFVRNMIVAGVLTKGDFGIASYFALTLSVLEMLSDMAVDKLLIQAEDGDDERLQGAAHVYQFLRGLAIGAMLLVLAAPVASLFGAPESAPAFQALALLPLARGLAHLDVRRVQRGMRFGPNTWVYVVPQAISALLAWPVTVWIGNYWAVLWLIVGQGALMSVMSHIIAERPYRWSWGGAHFGRIFRFGWPLILNGLLLLGVVHGDRLLIAKFLSAEDMGVFSLALLMAMTPMALIAKVMGDLMLPICSRPVHDGGSQTRYTRMMSAYLLVALLLALGAIGMSGPVLVWLFGAKYVDAIAVLQWLGVANAIRIVRAGFILQSVANGDTVTSMWTSAGRLVGVPLAAVAIFQELGLVWIAGAALVGELVALVPGVIRLRRSHSLSNLPLVPVFIACVALAALLAGATDLVDSLWLQASLTLGMCGGVGIVVLRTGNRFIHDEQHRWNGDQRTQPTQAHSELPAPV
ncbi:MAG: oligosaccharide flippase family protein [Phycisphaerales bacterium JB043]